MNNRNTFTNRNGSCDSKTQYTVYIQTTVSYRSYTVDLEELHCTLQAAIANTKKQYEVYVLNNLQSYLGNMMFHHFLLFYLYLCWFYLQVILFCEALCNLADK